MSDKGKHSQGKRRTKPFISCILRENSPEMSLKDPSRFFKLLNTGSLNLLFATASFQSISPLAFTEKLLLKVPSIYFIPVNSRKLLAVIGNLICLLFAAFSV